MSRQFLVLCENGLKRDENVIRQVLLPRPARIMPCLGETLDERAARLVKRNAGGLSGRQKPVLVVHRDADLVSAAERRRQIDDWVATHELGDLVAAVIPCVPEPCIERWLCAGASLKVKARQTLRPCEPWKKAWEAAPGSEWSRLEVAISNLILRRSLADFTEFIEMIRRAPS